MEFLGHPIFKDLVFQTPEYKAFKLKVKKALAITVKQNPHTIAIQKAIPTVNNHLQTMTSVIQNGQATYTQALYSLEELLTTQIEQRIERIASALNKFIEGSFHFVPKGYQVAPITRASSLPNKLVALPVTALAKAAEVPLPQYHMSQTIQTIPKLWQEWTIRL
ncbi:hypothetical protein B7463_g7065, partial [Scytalidium lignicola]